MVWQRIGQWRERWRPALHPAPLIGLGVILSLVIGKQVGWLQPWELQAYDQLVRLFNSRPPDPRLLVVEITEADFQAQGQAPVPDSALVEALEQLQLHQPALIALDLFRDLPVLRSGETGSTRTVAESLDQFPNTLAICRIGDETNPNGIPAPSGVPLERVGYVDVVQDGDGVIRRNLLFLDPPPTSLCQTRNSLASLAVLRYLDQQGFPPPIRTPQGLIWGRSEIPRLSSNWGAYQSVDAQGFQILLNYRSRDRVAERVSLTEVLSQQVTAEQVQGRIVLIGVTAESAKDSFPTPYQRGARSSQPMAGVLIHAQSISQLLGIVLEGESPMGTWPEGIEILWIGLWGAAGGLLGYRLGNPVHLGLAGGALVIGVGGCGVVLYLQQLWVPLIGPGLAGIFTGLAGRLTRAYLRELLLAGRYRVIRQLGAGGMGVVNLAQDTQQGDRYCVVKQLHLPAHNPKAISTYKRLFRNEGSILTSLGMHPQIPTLYAHFYFEEEHQFYLVEEYIPGHSLDHEIRTGRRLPPALVLKLLRELLQILGFIHAQHIVHRDIKPSNIIRRQTPSPLGHEFVLIDFGTVMRQSLSTGIDPSPDHAMIGTYGYAPYEQMEGNAVAASDIYALGMVGIQALTGKSISDVTSLLETQSLSSYGGRQIHWCHSVSLTLEPQLISILDRMVQLELTDRYPSVAEVIRDLAQLPDEPVRQPQVEPPAEPLFITPMISLSEQTTITHDQDTIAREEPMTQPLQAHPYAAIIFDMDGVIVLSESIHLEAGQAALERYGLQLDFKAIHSQFRGRTDADMFAYILETYPSVTPVSLKRLIQDKTEIFLSRLDRVAPVQGSIEFVRQVRRYCSKVGLTTSASRQEQQRVFQIFDLQPWFDGVITADDVEQAKPDPEPYLKTVQRLGCDPSRCLVIEDAIHGIQSARAAGCQVIGITTSFPQAPLLEAGALTAIDSFSELHQYLHQPHT